MKAVTAALFAVVALASCSSGHPVATATANPTKTSRSAAEVPGDGVRFTGAIAGIYPISNGGTCPVLDTLTGRELQISANPSGGQAYMGGIVENFTGPGAYSDVQWPPQGHSSLYVAFGGRTWRAESGVIAVASFGGGTASGTLSASNLREVNGSTTVNAAGSWTCRLLFPATTQPSPSPTPIVYPSPAPPPVGTPVPRQVLPPATVGPAVDLCSADLVSTANGNVYPLLCQGGAVNVPAWSFYVQVSSNILALGRDVTLQQVQEAMCADQSQYHATYIEESSAYELAAAYYGWSFTPEPNCR
jgi:hypothetical protein